MIKNLRLTVRKLSNLSPQLKTILFYYFATGFVFWYGIEKIFLQSIGFSATEIIITLNIAYGAGVLLELPSSVLADRWSRSKTLAISMAFAWSAALVGSLTTELWQYSLVMLFWATASALHTGTFEALLYDTLKEDGKEHKFNKIYASFNAVFATALVISISLSGILASQINLRAPFIATLFLMPLASFRIWRLNEPKHYKKDQELSNKGHLIKVLRNIMNKKILLVIGGVFIITNYLIAIPIYDFLELYLKDHNVPLFLIGMFKAITTNLIILIATPLIIRLYPKAKTLLLPIYLIIGPTLYLSTINNSAYLLVFLAIGIVLHQTASTWLQSASQVHIPSAERASTSSALNTTGSIFWLLFSVFVARSLEDSGGNGAIRASAYGAFFCLTFICIIYILKLQNRMFVTGKPDTNNLNIDR